MDVVKVQWWSEGTQLAPKGEADGYGLAIELRAAKRTRVIGHAEVETDAGFILPIGICGITIANDRLDDRKMMLITRLVTFRNRGPVKCLVINRNTLPQWLEEHEPFGHLVPIVGVPFTLEEITHPERGRG